MARWRGSVAEAETQEGQSVVGFCGPVKREGRMGFAQAPKRVRHQPKTKEPKKLLHFE